jgi:hypothetical protein
VQKFLKLLYYNISLGLVIWLLTILYQMQINSWWIAIGFVIIVIVFIAVTSKVLRILKHL